MMNTLHTDHDKTLLSYLCFISHEEWSDLALEMTRIVRDVFSTYFGGSNIEENRMGHQRKPHLITL